MQPKRTRKRKLSGGIPDKISDVKAVKTDVITPAMHAAIDQAVKDAVKDNKSSSPGSVRRPAESTADARVVLPPAMSLPSTSNSGVNIEPEGQHNSAVDERRVISKTMARCYEFATKHMDPVIRISLLSKGLINENDTEKARKKEDNESKQNSCELLLEALTRAICSKEQFVTFLNVLKDRGQTKLKEQYQQAYKELGGTSDALDV